MRARPAALTAPFLVCLLAGAAAAGCRAEGAAGTVAGATALGFEGEANAAWGAGFVVWESNRTGAFRIWRRALEGGPPVQLSAEEPGRDHCCAHVSPDGQRIAYLSIPGGSRAYLPPTTDGELHLMLADGSLDRVVARPARHYGEHLAAVWWSEDELLYIDGDNASVLLDLSTGARRVMARGPADGEGWLVDPTGRWASGGTPSFSARRSDGSIARATPLGGCQPYFERGGRFGYWSAGAGGPIDALELETRRSFTLLAKGDPRLPRERGYLYFPRLSPDGSLLAVAGSDGAHDHFTSDYDVLVIEVDPESLAPIGRAIRITTHPAVDRFPDLFRAEPPPRAPARPHPSAADRPPAVEAAPSWPAARERLALVWEGSDRPNRIAADAASDVLAAHGRATFDRRGRISLGGGYFQADEATSRRVIETLRASNTLSFEAVVEPADLGASGPIVALSVRPGRRSFRVEQAGDRLRLVLRTAETDGTGGSPVELVRFEDRRPRHVAFTYSPGRLAVYLDGEPAGRFPVPGDFFHWQNGWLLIGAEAGSDERFRGALSHLAIHAAELDAGTVAASARLALAALASAPAPPFAEVEARLLARSRPPTLEEISPYRQALVTEEWEVLRALAGVPLAGRIRVARWSLLDGAPTPEAADPLGTVRRLRLEPHAAQPQLESIVLSDTLPPAPAGGPPLGFDVAWSGGG